MTDRKQTLIIDTGEEGDRNIINHNGDFNVNILHDFTVNLSRPLTISKTCNIFIDHITLSGARPSMVIQPFDTAGVFPDSEVKFVVAGEGNISLGAAAKLETLSATEGPMLQLKIIGIGTSTSMEHNPYVNATNPVRLDLQKTFQFSNTNNRIIPGYGFGGVPVYWGNLNVHTYTDTTFNYVSTIKASSKNPVKIKSIRFNLTYKWANENGRDGQYSVFNQINQSTNRAIIEFLFDPI